MYSCYHRLYRRSCSDGNILRFLLRHKWQPLSLSQDIVQQPLLLLQRASFSESAVVIDSNSMDDCDENDDTTTTSVIHEMSRTGTQPVIHKKRPRLEALRQSLQQMNAPHLQVFAAQPSSSSSPNVVVQVNQKNVKPLSTTSTNSSSTTTTSTTTTSTLTKNQIDQIRDMLSYIPDPTTNSSSSSGILQDKHQRFHNYLRISVSERCNLRCTYCMPEQGIPLQPKHQLLTKDEIVHLASIFTKRGVNKFRITGGEPTLRRDLIDIVSALKRLPILPQQQQQSSPLLDTSPQYPSIGMTTNGITLYQNILEYHAAGLNGVNISLDTLDEHKFSQLTRRPSTYFHNVMKSIQSAIDITTTIDPNFVVKINCVIMRHMNDNEIVDFIQLTERYPTVQIRFIEYMPFQENGWKDDKFIPYQEIISHINQRSDTHQVHLVPVPSNDPHDTTKWYTNQTTTYSTTANPNTVTTTNTNNNNTSRIGFITSMSQHFCNSCNRLRLTADGQLKVCLFDGSSDTTTNNNNNKTTDVATSSISLRDALRNDFTTNEIEKLIYLSVQKKHAILGGHTDPTHIMLDSNNNRPMTLIGG